MTTKKDFFNLNKYRIEYKFNVKINNKNWVESINILNTHLPDHFPKVTAVSDQEDAWTIEKPGAIIVTPDGDGGSIFTVTEENFETATNKFILMRFMCRFYGSPNDRDQNIIWISNLPFKFDITAFCEKYAREQELTEDQFRQILVALNIKSVDKLMSDYREYLIPNEMKNKIERVFITNREHKLSVGVIAKELEESEDKIIDFLINESRPSWLYFDRVDSIVFCSSKRLEKFLHTKFEK